MEKTFTGNGDNQGRIVTMDILQNNRVLCAFKALDFDYVLGRLPMEKDENGKDVHLATLTHIGNFRDSCVDSSGFVVGNLRNYHMEKSKDSDLLESVVIEIIHEDVELEKLTEETISEVYAFITHPNGYKNKKQYSVVEDHYRVDGFVWDKAFKMLRPLSDTKQIKVR